MLNSKLMNVFKELFTDSHEFTMVTLNRASTSTSTGLLKYLAEMRCLLCAYEHLRLAESEELGATLQAKAVKRDLIRLIGAWKRMMRTSLPMPPRNLHRLLNQGKIYEKSTTWR